MVDSEPKRPLMPEVADDVGAGFRVPGDNRLRAQQEQMTLKEEGGGYHRDDHEYRTRHGGDGGEYERDEGGRMRQMEDDPHGNAAMALTALSFGVRDLERRTSWSGFQGFSGQQEAATERGVERSQIERGRESKTPSFSEKPLRDLQETFTDATVRAGGGSRQQHQQHQDQQEQQQHQQSAMQPLTLHLPLSVTMTPSSSSSALNTSTLTASESTSPISAQEDVASRDTLITPQEQRVPHAPGERMQSLSHMLKDRLSLVTFRTEQGWDRVDMNMSEQRMTREEFRQPERRDDLQHYQDYHERLSPSHQDEFSAHPSRFLRDQPKAPSVSFLHGQDRSIRRQQWEFPHDSRSQQHQRDLQQPPQLHSQQQQHHRTQSSSSIQDDRGPSHRTTQISPLPIMDRIVVKPKRKYTKKSSLLPQARVETHDQVNLQTRQESNELLYSDRGLILKTQIPKKGRPISKHSTTSSQSTPTLTSLGILPASHNYFSKAGTPSSSSSSSTMPGLVAAAAGRYHSDSTLSTYSSSPQGAHPSLMSDQRSPVVSPTGRRPGRPSSNSSLPHHAHSQSYSSGPTISFPSPHSGQARPLPSPTAHQSDFHSTQYKDQQTPQELDDNRFSAYPDRSPTLSKAITASSQQPSFCHRQLPEYRVPTSHRRYVSSPIDQEFSGEELEYRNEDNDPQYPGQRRRTVDTPSAMPLRSFAEGVPAQMNTLKRSSSGMQKSLSMDGYHNRLIENRRRRSVGGGGVGCGGRGAMGYGTDGQFEDVNEEAGSNFFDEEFDDSAVDARSRKRISGSDLGYSGVDGIGAESAGNAGSGSVRRRVNHQGSNRTWHGATLGSERRPRSLVLPRGGGELALPWTDMLDSGSRSGLGLGSGSGSGSTVGVLPGRRHLDIDDDEIDYREMMIMTPAIAPGPPSPPPPPPAALSSPSNSPMISDGTRGKGRGGRSMHSYARSLDITSFSALSHRGHRPLSPSSLDRPSRHDMYSTEELLPEQQHALTSGRRIYASSSSSLNSPPFGDTLSFRIDQGIINTEFRGTPSGTDRRRHNHLDTAPQPPITTRADILAREMMSGTRSTSSGGGSGRGRGRRGLSHGHYHLKAAVAKRSTSKRGPGPHLKKHQILQQQLYQIQRDQEEIELQMALQLQQRQMQQQEQLEQEQEQERQGLEQQRQLRQQKQQQQQRKAPYPQRHQHSQSLQLQHEFSSHEFNQQQQQQEQQQQPRPGRPTKQRVLLRSESALAVLHGMHSPPLGSTLSQSQSQPSLPQSSTAATISTSSIWTPQPSSRRRQNQQQPILLRPVSLPSLTGSSGNGSGGSGCGGGAGGMDSGSSPPYLMNHPPPGQPLFRSLHAPYLVSPSSLISVASNASSSTRTTGTEVALATLGRSRGSGGEKDEEDEDGDEDRSRGLSSAVKSPHISYSTTPPLAAGSRMFSPPYSYRDSQGYPPHPQPYQPHHHHQQQQQSNHYSHHHHPYQRPFHHSISTNSISSITSLNQDNLSTTSSMTTLSKRSSHPPGAISMSRSSSRGGMSTSSSATTLVHSSTSQSSLHQHQQHHQHRHSSSLPSLNYYYQSSTASSSSTSPQHPLGQKNQQKQQQRMSNNPLPMQQNDPTRPPIHRMVSHDTQPTALPLHKHTPDSTTDFHPPTSGPRSQPSTTTTATTTTTTTTTVGEEESVERLLIRTPLGDV